MKAPTKWLPELLLGAALLTAIGLLASPRRPSRGLPAPAASAAPAPAAEQPPPSPPIGRKPAAPGQIASLFGWTEPVAAPRAATTPAGPTEAGWLKPVGFVIGEGGVPSYVFKDTKSNVVLSLMPKVENKGWTLREAREKEFLLVYNGTEFVVKRNE